MAEDVKNEEKRSFEGPDGKTYFITTPSASEVKEADWKYSHAYTRSLTEGITTSAEMMDILRRRGIIGPEFEQRQSELNSNLNQKIWDLEAQTDFDKKRDLAVEVAVARDELFQWNQRLNGPMSNTCEQLADDARLEYLSACMIVDENGERVWKSFEDYQNEANQALALKSRFEVMLFLQGLESDFLERTPEAVAMKEVEQDLISKAEEAAKALIDASEEDAEEKPKKKVTRKPRKKKSDDKE